MARRFFEKTEKARVHNGLGLLFLGENRYRGEAVSRRVLEKIWLRLFSIATI